MERNIMSSGLKDHKIGSRFTRDSISSSNGYNNQNSGNKMKDSCQQRQQQSYGEEYLSGFSWPPRSYTCSFCKREFRSAQALGGHMNVHRRDRARLRISPPTPKDIIVNNNINNGQYPLLNLNLNPNPNPNPNPNFSTPPLVSPFSSLSSQSSTSPSEIKKWSALTGALSPKDSVKKNEKLFSGAKEFGGFTEEDDGFKLSKKGGEIVRLDLEIGVISDSKEDLDLELRLGYS
ncbi:hypothetical protein AB3S75_044563 [Citrus x aurantiifolia]